MHKLRILILYPDPAGLALLTSMLKSLGHIIEEATTDRVAVRLMERNNIDLVLAGVDPLDGEALELLTYVRRKHREVPVILLFPRLHPERAKEALRLGAMAVLKYPVPAAELRAAVLQALERCETRPAEPAASTPRRRAGRRQAGGLTSPRRTRRRRRPPAAAAPACSPSLADRASADVIGAGFECTPPASCQPHRVELLAREIGLIGNDPSWRQVIDLAVTIAATRTSVLIVGEPGTGKSLLARLIHSLGPDADRPFVTVEGSTMADEQLDARAARDSRRPPERTTRCDWSNKLAQAHGGTLYLDEVAALPLELQLHLLRELQFRDYEASAGHPVQPGEARFVMSTSENLTRLDRAGPVPPGALSPHQRDQPDAAPLAAPGHRRRAAGRVVPDPICPRIPQDRRRLHPRCPRRPAEARLAGQRPRARGRRPARRRPVQRPPDHLEPSGADPQPPPPDARPAAATPRPHLKMGVRPLKEALEEPEKRIIIQALQAFNWNRQETARVLDINRTTLYKKMKKYNLLIDEPVWVN